jgi:hypothetical protein
MLKNDYTTISYRPITGIAEPIKTSIAEVFATHNIRVSPHPESSQHRRNPHPENSAAQL